MLKSVVLASLVAAATSAIWCIDCPTSIPNYGPVNVTLGVNAAESVVIRAVFMSSRTNWGAGTTTIAAGTNQVVTVEMMIGAATRGRGTPPLGQLDVRDGRSSKYWLEIYESPLDNCHGTSGWRTCSNLLTLDDLITVFDNGDNWDHASCPNCPAGIPEGGSVTVTLDYTILPVDNCDACTWHISVELYNARWGQRQWLTHGRREGRAIVAVTPGNGSATFANFFIHYARDSKFMSWRKRWVVDIKRVDIHGTTTLFAHNIEIPNGMDPNLPIPGFVECVNCPARIAPFETSMDLTLKYTNAPIGVPLRIGAFLQFWKNEKGRSFREYGKVWGTTTGETAEGEFQLTLNFIQSFGVDGFGAGYRLTVYSMESDIPVYKRNAVDLYRMFRERFPLTVEEPKGIKITPEVIYWSDGGIMEFQVVLESEPADLLTVSLANMGNQFSALSSCFLVFDAHNWDVPQRVFLTALPTMHIRDQVFHIKALTNKADGELHSSIAVTLRPTPSGQCLSNGDPHYTSFDNQRFDFMGSGDHYMVHSPTLSIQSRMQQCGKNRGITCNTGVAIKSGPGVFVITTDPTKPGAKIAFLSQETGGIQVSSVSHDVYRITTRDGAAVTVGVFGGRRSGYMNIQIVLPGGYFKCVQGICGSWDDDPHNDHEGFASAQQHLHSWLAKPSESLFSFPFCGNRPFVGTCGSADVAVDVPDFIPLECTGELVNRPVVDTFTADDGPAEDITALLVETFTARLEPPPQPVFVPSGETVTLFDTPEEEADATATCTALYYGSALGDACNTLGIDVDGYYESCLLDLAAFGDVSIADQGQRVLFVECKAALDQKVAEDEGAPDPPGEDDVNVIGAVTEAFAVTCPGGCSSHGTCNNGTCTCDADWAGLDCDIATNVPPATFSCTGRGDEATIGTGEQVVMTGSDFLACANLRCVFEHTTEGVKLDSEPNVVSSSMAFCVVPAFANESAVKISMETDCGVSVDSCTSQTFVQRPPPPPVAVFQTHEAILYCGDYICFRSPLSVCGAWPSVPVVHILGVDDVNQVIYGVDKRDTVFKSEDHGLTWWVSGARSTSGLTGSFYGVQDTVVLGGNIYTVSEERITAAVGANTCSRIWDCTCD